MAKKRNGSAKRKRGGQDGVPKKWTNLPSGRPVRLPVIAQVVIRLGQALAVLPDPEKLLTTAGEVSKITGVGE